MKCVSTLYERARRDNPTDILPRNNGVISQQRIDHNSNGKPILKTERKGCDFLV
jgi:hypothetical protein